LVRLPKQSIDTGAGFERVISLKMGVDSLFETDILRALISEIEKVFHVTYDPQDLKLFPAFRVIADHLRSLSFAIADGAQPSNIERGYVLRKILRRAVRYGRMLGQQEPFLAKILPRLVALMGQDYPELKSSEGRIAEILTTEEENFFRTLKRGGNMLNQVIQESSKKNHVISGEDAFKLKDTYGLPFDEIALIAIDAGLTLDKAGFDKLESEAKERSRGSRKEGTTEVSEALFKEYREANGPTKFLGYETLNSFSTITALMKEGEFVEKLEAGQEGSVFLNETPFYAEKGGQTGDRGTLETSSALFEVKDTQAPYPEVVTHIGQVKSGTLKVGDTLQAHLYQKLRQRIANNHSATHLLHYALQQILGPHVKQAGSIVEPGRLRFDFSHHKSLLPEEILAIEDLVNELIRSNTPVSTYELSLEEASKKKEIKQFFGEKYGSKVRVVDMGLSKELCGGTHTSSTGTIGYFRISKESSIASGIRRIEAVTGHEADLYVREREKKYIESEEALLEKNKELAADVKTLRLENLSISAFHHLKSVEKIDSIPLLLLQLEIEPKEMKDLADLLFKETSSLALALFVPDGERCSFLFRVSPDLIAKGLKADAWMKEISPILGGKGGGKADTAQGGGSLPNKIPEALNQAREWIRDLSKKSS
jgi:alanyl-tRNA synthetase